MPHHMGHEWPGTECANSTGFTMTSSGLWAACPSHLTHEFILVNHAGLAGGGQQLSTPAPCQLPPALGYPRSGP